jgi:hypothetical protein
MNTDQKQELNCRTRHVPPAEQSRGELMTRGAECRCNEQRTWKRKKKKIARIVRKNRNRMRVRRVRTPPPEGKEKEGKGMIEKRAPILNFGSVRA